MSEDYRHFRSSGSGVQPSPRSGGQQEKQSSFTLLLKELTTHKNLHDRGTRPALGQGNGNSTTPSQKSQEQEAEVDLALCQKVLAKLQRILPKFSRHLSTPSADSEAVNNVCQLFDLLLTESICPHSLAVFNNGHPCQVVPHFLALVQVVFLEKYEVVRETILHTIESLAQLLMTSDIQALGHIVDGTIVLLDDLLLLRLETETMTNSHAKPFSPQFQSESKAGLRLAEEAAVESYHDLAMHVYLRSQQQTIANQGQMAADDDGPVSETVEEIPCVCFCAEREVIAQLRRSAAKDDDIKAEGVDGNTNDLRNGNDSRSSTKGESLQQSRDKSMDVVNLETLDTQHNGTGDDHKQDALALESDQYQILKFILHGPDDVRRLRVSVFDLLYRIVTQSWQYIATPDREHALFKLCIQHLAIHTSLHRDSASIVPGVLRLLSAVVKGSRMISVERLLSQSAEALLGCIQVELTATSTDQDLNVKAKALLEAVIGRMGTEAGTGDFSLHTMSDESAPTENRIQSPFLYTLRSLLSVFSQRLATMGLLHPSSTGGSLPASSNMLHPALFGEKQSKFLVAATHSRDSLTSIAIAAFVSLVKFLLWQDVQIAARELTALVPFVTNVRIHPLVLPCFLEVLDRMPKVRQSCLVALLEMKKELDLEYASSDDDGDTSKVTKRRKLDFSISQNSEQMMESPERTERSTESLKTPGAKSEIASKRVASGKVPSRVRKRTQPTGGHRQQPHQPLTFGNATLTDNAPFHYVVSQTHRVLLSGSATGVSVAEELLLLGTSSHFVLGVWNVNQGEGHKFALLNIILGRMLFLCKGSAATSQILTSPGHFDSVLALFLSIFTKIIRVSAEASQSTSSSELAKNEGDFWSTTQEMSHLLLSLFDSVLAPLLAMAGEETEEYTSNQIFANGMRLRQDCDNSAVDVGTLSHVRELLFSMPAVVKYFAFAAMVANSCLTAKISNPRQSLCKLAVSVLHSGLKHSDKVARESAYRALPLMFQALAPSVRQEPSLEGTLKLLTQQVTSVSEGGSLALLQAVRGIHFAWLWKDDVSHHSMFADWLLDKLRVLHGPSTAAASAPCYSPTLTELLFSVFRLVPSRYDATLRIAASDLLKDVAMCCRLSDDTGLGSRMEVEESETNLEESKNSTPSILPRLSFYLQTVLKYIIEPSRTIRAAGREFLPLFFNLLENKTEQGMPRRCDDDDGDCQSQSSRKNYLILLQLVFDAQDDIAAIEAFWNFMRDHLTEAEQQQDDNLIVDIMKSVGRVGSVANRGDSIGRELLTWCLVTLLDLWSRRSSDAIGSVACEQVLDVLKNQEVTLRRLCTRYPRQLYPALLQQLLSRGTLQKFLQLFITEDVSPQEFLRAASEYVLPSLVLQQDYDNLVQFARGLEMIDADDERKNSVVAEEVVDRRTSKRRKAESAREEKGTAKRKYQDSVTNLLGMQMEHIVLEIIMSQVAATANGIPRTQSDYGRGQQRADKKSLVQEWDFLLSFFSKGTTIKDLIEYRMSPLVRCLAWELAGERPAAARGAFKRVAEVFSAKSAHEDRAGGGDSVSGDNTASATQRFARSRFLLMISDLSLKTLRKGKQYLAQDRIRALRCIQQLLILTGSEGLVPYIPKVMATLKQAMQHDELKLVALESWQTFVEILSDQSIAANLGSIVVSLLPCIQEQNLREEEIIVRSDSVVPPGAGSRAQGKKLLVLGDLPHSTGETDNRGTVSKFQGGNSRAAQREQPSQLPLAADSNEVQGLAVRILEYLFVTKREHTRQAFQQVPFIPKVPALRKVSMALREELGDMREIDMSERLRQLTELLQHESTSVRKMAITQLSLTMRRREPELHQLMIHDDSIAEVVCSLLQALLRMCSTESDPHIKLASAEALGTLGAVDPARLPSHGILASTYAISGLPERQKVGGKIPVAVQQARQLQGGTGMDSSQAPPGGELADDALAFHLIEDFLVQELRAAPESTDHVAFAIQELLRFLDATQESEKGNETLSSKIMGNSSEQVGRRRQEQELRPFPEWMRMRFEGKGIYDIVEPYWTTNYTSTSRQTVSGHPQAPTTPHWPARRSSSSSLPAGSRQNNAPSFYSRHPTFDTWLVSWAKDMINKSHGPFREIFVACRGVLRLSPSITRTLLPYLLQNVLQTDPIQEETSSDGNNADSILAEILDVLEDRDSSSDSNSKHHMSSQVIFSLLDELKEWIRAAEMVEHTSAVGGLGSSVLDAGRAKVQAKGDKQCLERLLADIPNQVLSAAAVRINAHARALVYYESFIRESGASLEPSGNLSLTRLQLSVLQQLYSQIDEPDGLVGIAAVRRKLSTRNLSGESATNAPSLPYLPLLKANLNTTKLTVPELLSSLQERIIDLEHSGKWSEALLCYERALQLFSSSTITPFPGETKLSSAEESNTRAQAIASLPSIQKKEDSGQSLSTSSWTDVGDLHAGTLRCMRELGHLDTVLHLAHGILSQHQYLTPNIAGFAMDAAWKLSRWDVLSDLVDTIDKLPEAKGLGPEVALARVIAAVRGRDAHGVGKLLTEARKELLSPLAAASMESYQRTLPILDRLHVLHEAEQGFLALVRYEQQPWANSSSASANDSNRIQVKIEVAKSIWQEQCGWENRLKLMVPSLQQKEPVLSLRRMFCEELGLTKFVSHNWLQLAKFSRAERSFQTASRALIHAESMGELSAVLEDAKLLYDQGQIHAALLRLEPVEFQAATVFEQIAGKQLSPEYAKVIARNLLMATNWMQEAGLKQSSDMITRYKAVIRLQPQWEKGYFFLGKYYDFLLETLLGDMSARNHLQSQKAGTPSSTSALNDGGDSGTRQKGSSSSTTSRPSISGSNNTLDLALQYVYAVLANYAKSLRFGTKYIFQSLPRMLTLWFEYGEILHLQQQQNQQQNQQPLQRAQSYSLFADMSVTRQKTLKGSETDEIYWKRMNELNEIMLKALDTLPTYQWLTAFPQIASRICHPNPAVVDVVMQIMVYTLCSYTRHAMWTVVGLSRSINKERRDRASNVLRQAREQLIANRQQGQANSLQHGEKLFDDLITLAKTDPGRQRRIRVRFSDPQSQILAPLQAALSVTLPDTGSTMGSDAEDHNPFPSHQVYIQRFHEIADVMNSKEKPKKVSIRASDGRDYSFLCKREQHGDLRKDARIMEFNSMINRLLQKNAEGRRRKLRLRTYAVICLNEECGLLEWVPNTSGLRQIVAKINRTELGCVPAFRLTKEIKKEFEDMQEKYADKPAEMAAHFQSRILSLPLFSPRFHVWFVENFRDPTDWFESRLSFARSAAVWSMVGHVVGLGDRHGENVLIDTTNGECVHVDFDCLFDKGLSLARPEIVPFRLTPNMVDAFGPTGYEGVFRQVSEVAMTVLRGHRETLMSVLEAFIHDPLVEWSRSGRAQSGLPRQSKNGRSEEDAEESKRILATINERLKGIYNYNQGSRARRRARLQTGSGSGSGDGDGNRLKADSLPLSVQGQVHRLIQEAVSMENLAQMYIGWMPFL